MPTEKILTRCTLENFLPITIILIKTQSQKARRAGTSSSLSHESKNHARSTQPGPSMTFAMQHVDREYHQSKSYGNTQGWGDRHHPIVTVEAKFRLKDYTCGARIFHYFQLREQNKSSTKDMLRNKTKSLALTVKVEEAWRRYRNLHHCKRWRGQRKLNGKRPQVCSLIPKMQKN